MLRQKKSAAVKAQGWGRKIQRLPFVSLPSRWWAWTWAGYELPLELGLAAFSIPGDGREHRSAFPLLSGVLCKYWPRVVSIFGETMVRTAVLSLVHNKHTLSTSWLLGAMPDPVLTQLNMEPWPPTCSQICSTLKRNIKNKQNK